MRCKQKQQGWIPGMDVLVVEGLKCAEVGVVGGLESSTVEEAALGPAHSKPVHLVRAVKR